MQQSKMNATNMLMDEKEEGNKEKFAIGEQHAVTTVKLYCCHFPAYFSIRNHCEINCSFDEIQFTVIAAVLLQ